MTSEIDRKTLKGPDEFQNALGKGFAAAKDNSKTILTIVGVIALVAVGAGIYFNKRDAKQMVANNALYQATSQLEKRLIELRNKATPADPKAKVKTEVTQPVKINVDADLAANIQALEKVSKDHSGTVAGNEALLAIGDLYFQYGAPAKAYEWYTKAYEANKSGREGYLAQYSLGYAKEAMGDLDGALKHFESATSLGKKDLGLNADILMAQARVLQKKNETAKAQELYQKIMTQFPNSEYAKRAAYFKNRPLPE